MSQPMLDSLTNRAGIVGVVVDAQSQCGIEGASMRLKWFDNERVRMRYERSASDGTFAFAGGALPAPVFVAARQAGYLSCDVEWRAAPVRIELTRAATVRLSGMVCDETGAPVSNACVSVRTTNMRQWWDRYAVLLGCDAQTDARGYFTCDFVPAGLSNLYPQVHHDVFPKCELYQYPFDTAHGDVQLDLVIAHGIAVTGIVRYATGGAVSGAYVWAEETEHDEPDAWERTLPVR